MTRAEPEPGTALRAAEHAGGPAPAATPAGRAVRALAETIDQHADRPNGLACAEQDHAAIARRP